MPSPSSTAHQLTPVARRMRRRITIGYYLAFIALGLANASIGPTLPGLAAHTGTTLQQISFLFVARSLGYLVGALLAGQIYDRMRGHPILITMLLSIGAGLAITPLIPLFWLLVGIIFLLGMSEGTLDVGGNTLLVWLHGNSVGPYMNGLHFFFGIGASLSAAIIGESLGRTGDITWGYWGLALLVAPTALWFVRLPSPTGQGWEGSPRERVSGADPLLLRLMVLFFFLYVAAELSVGFWTFTYSVAAGIPERTAAYITAAFWIALTVGRLLSVPLAARLRPRTLLRLDLAGCLLSVGILLLWPDRPAAIWLGVIGVGLSMAAIFPTMITLAERTLPVTGRITSYFLVGGALGGMVLPWLIGQQFEGAGARMVMLLIFVDLLLGTAVFYLVSWRADRVAAARHGERG